MNLQQARTGAVFDRVAHCEMSENRTRVMGDSPRNLLIPGPEGRWKIVPEFRTLHTTFFGRRALAVGLAGKAQQQSGRRPGSGPAT